MQRMRQGTQSNIRHNILMSRSQLGHADCLQGVCNVMFLLHHSINCTGDIKRLMLLLMFVTGTDKKHTVLSTVLPQVTAYQLPQTIL